MIDGIIKALRFALERWIQRGVAHQLVVMTALVALVAVLGGLAAWVASPGFASAPEACWWAFLRLTDPGYLGDDEGLALRVISTIITILGYVIFMGSLIAIMTQWLARTMRKLELGFTPITMHDHIVVLGWTNRTPEIVAKLLGAKGRLDRFLEEHGAGKLRVVVLSEEVDTERRIEMRDHLGALWNNRQIFLRSGSSLRPEHLERLDLCRAAVVIVPGAEFELGGADLTDARVVKTLITMRNLFREVPVDRRPQVVAEIFDTEMLPVAVGALDEKMEVIPSDRLISRLVSQSIQHRGMAGILFDMLAHREGSSLYLRCFPELAGHALRALTDAFPEAIVLGLVRREAGVPKAVLDPGSREIVRADDLLVLLTDSYAQCLPGGAPPPSTPRAPEPTSVPWSSAKLDQRVLVLGWSHRVVRLIEEFDESRSERFEVTIMSRVGLEQRRTELERVEFSEERVQIHHVCADYAVQRDLVRVVPSGFDHVLFLASSSMDSSQESDARTVLGYELLRSLMDGDTAGPEVLVELLDPANAHLFEEAGHGLVMVSPRLVSDVLAQVALRPELNAVIDALFCSGGTEFELCPAADLGLAGRAVRFSEVQQVALQQGVIALGIMARADSAPAVELNPNRGKSWTLTDNDQLVVLTTRPAAQHLRSSDVELGRSEASEPPDVHDAPS
jgi:ion channel POLLUX/CASTOR